jgi:hypothetical protein
MSLVFNNGTEKRSYCSIDIGNNNTVMRPRLIFFATIHTVRPPSSTGQVDVDSESHHYSNKYIHAKRIARKELHHRNVEQRVSFRDTSSESRMQF